MRLHMVLGSLSPQYAALFVIERAAAFVFQLGFSVLMWQMLRERFRYTLPLMIAAHALIDLPAALFQARVIPLLAADAVYLVFGADRRARADAVFPRGRRAAGRLDVDDTPFQALAMDDYQYDCPSADIDMLAHVISDLFPEQTQFAERLDDEGRTSLVIHYIAMRFGSTARRISIDVRFDPAALARYRAMPVRLHARELCGAARVCRGDARLAGGSVCERGGVPRTVEIEMGEDFA